MPVTLDSIKITDVTSGAVFEFTNMGEWISWSTTLAPIFCRVNGLVTYTLTVKNTDSVAYSATLKLDDVTTGSPIIPTKVTTLQPNSWVQHSGLFTMPSTPLYLITKMYIGNGLRTESFTVSPYGADPDPTPDPTPDPDPTPTPDPTKVSNWGNDPISLMLGAASVLALALLLDRERKK